MTRNLMVDVITEHSLGCQAGSLAKWAAGQVDPLSVAVHDFPPLGIVVSANSGWTFAMVNLMQCYSVACSPGQYGLLCAVYRLRAYARFAMQTK